MFYCNFFVDLERGLKGSIKYYGVSEDDPFNKSNIVKARYVNTYFVNSMVSVKMSVRLV